MGWKSAFLDQARSDQAVFDRLNDPAVEYRHRLHYLQMLTEKLSKALLIDTDNSEPPAPTHAVFVSMLQTLKGRPDLRRKLGYRDMIAFRSYINSLLDVARTIEQLAPAIAGTNRPNPEYPWRDKTSAAVIAPAQYTFPAIDPRAPKILKLMELVRLLLKIGA